MLGLFWSAGGARRSSFQKQGSQGGRSIFLLLTRVLLYCSGWVAGIRQVSLVTQENRRPKGGAEGVA